MTATIADENRIKEESLVATSAEILRYQLVFFFGLESHFHADASCQTRQIYNYKKNNNGNSVITCLSATNFSNGVDSVNCSYNNPFPLGWRRVVSLDLSSGANRVFPAMKVRRKLHWNQTKLVRTTIMEFVESTWKSVAARRSIFWEARGITKNFWKPCHLYCCRR